MLRELTLTVQLRVLRAESVKYSEELEAEMEEAIWERREKYEAQRYTRGILWPD